jgi:hypothetical protein
MALVVLHEGEVEPEPELVVEAPVQARDQLRVPRVAHLSRHDTRTRVSSTRSAKHRPRPWPITTPLTKQADSAGVGLLPRCAPGWRRRRGPLGKIASLGPRTAAGGEGEGARGGWRVRRRRRRRGRGARARRRPPRGGTRTRGGRTRHSLLLPVPSAAAAAASSSFPLAPRGVAPGVFTSLASGGRAVSRGSVRGRGVGLTHADAERENAPWRGGRRRREEAKERRIGGVWDRASRMAGPRKRGSRQGSGWG